MIKLEEISDLNTLIRKLEEMAAANNVDSYVFRGQQNISWKLGSTFERYSTSILPEIRALAFDHLINQFAHRLSQIDDNSLVKMNRRGRLEYARHCGVPSPLIDFTRSPYIALWFAFNGVRGSAQQDQSVAIYALNWNMMGAAFDRLCRKQGQYEWIRNKFSVPPIDLFKACRILCDSGFPNQLNCDSLSILKENYHGQTTSC